MEGPTRVLLVPIFRRYWLWQAWGQRAAAAVGGEGQRAAHKALRDWREGQNLEEKAQLLGQHFSRWVRPQQQQQLQERFCQG